LRGARLKRSTNGDLTMLSRRTTITALLGAATAGWANLRAGAADPIRIGTILSVSGPAAFLGQDMKDGAQLAVDEINEAGGIGGRKIEWIFYDAQSQTLQPTVVDVAKRAFDFSSADKAAENG